MSDKVKPIPDGYHSITPYMCIDGAATAIDWYKEALGATELFRMEAPGGKIGHAEIKIGDSIIMLADEFPEMGFRGPKALGGTSINLMIYCDDVDSKVEKAVAAGATLTRPVKDQFYGDRSGGIQDPYGHNWYIATHIEDVAPEELEKRAAAAHGG